jgi:putative sigma-54 modulation protein
MQFFSKSNTLSFTKAMESYLIEKIEKLSKHVDDLNGKAVINKEGSLIKLEISLPGNIRASRSGSDYYILVIEVIEQLENQIKKFKSISKKKKHDNLTFNGEFEEEPYNVREKILIQQKLSRDEAIEEMELLGHSFFIYEDIDQRSTCVIYKRNDGEYGCIIVK